MLLIAHLQLLRRVLRLAIALLDPRFLRVAFAIVVARARARRSHSRIYRNE